MLNIRPYPDGSAGWTIFTTTQSYPSEEVLLSVIYENSAAGDWLRNNDDRIVSADSTLNDDEWEFDIRFVDKEAAAEFYSAWMEEVPSGD